ncbi:RNI-like protein [Rhizophagus irregularis]|nr:RNI-like protein [Rhizophagus irregularis]PKC75551.1 RNI-like protein [Rhizophagus irregularis]PKY27166.1 RNI-like protein [Rhizophagus irregularis]
MGHATTTVRIISAENVRKILKAWDFDKTVINSWYNDVEVPVEENDTFYVARIAILCGMKHFHASDCPIINAPHAKIHLRLTDKNHAWMAVFPSYLYSLNIQTAALFTSYGIASLKLLISACHSLRVLAISDIVDDELVKIITISCPSLRCIRLSSCDGVTDDSLELIVKTYPHLLSLDLGGDSCPISDAGIKSLTQSCTELQAIDLDNCEYITDKSIEYIANSCPNLKKLGLICCNTITENAIVALLRCCTQIETLLIPECNVSDKTISVITESCPQLRALDVCSKILTDEPVIALIESCRKVEDLVLHYRNMTTSVINTIAQNCPVLRLLDVECDQELSVDSIGTLLRGCTIRGHLALPENVTLNSDIDKLVSELAPHLMKRSPGIWISKSWDIYSIRDELELCQNI